MEHVVVFAEQKRFAGWPANNGVWIWDGQEILVGCTTGAYAEGQPFHNIKPPYVNRLCRSRDGGRTWRAERPEGFVSEGRELADLPRAINFTEPGLALRVVGDAYHGSAEKRGGFFVSHDRGANWVGPYRFRGLEDDPRLAGLILTPRTDYLAEGRTGCLVMLSATRGSLGDRAFCARTVDGGRTFGFAGWVVPPADPFRAVMPSTVRCADGTLVAAVRRRETPKDACWVDAYASTDGGRSWTPLGKVGDTGGRNGNPPALLRLTDGRLCCAYGRRDRRQMVARLSRDQGQTWCKEAVLRDDFPDKGAPDFGYPRVVQRSDGQVVVIYYWASRELPEQHIEATIWQP
jgi:hypothetical protein